MIGKLRINRQDRQSSRPIQDTVRVWAADSSVRRSGSGRSNRRIRRPDRTIRWPDRTTSWSVLGSGSPWPESARSSPWIHLLLLRNALTNRGKWPMPTPGPVAPTPTADWCTTSPNRPIGEDTSWTEKLKCHETPSCPDPRSTRSFFHLKVKLFTIIQSNYSNFFAINTRTVWQNATFFYHWLTSNVMLVDTLETQIFTCERHRQSVGRLSCK